MADRVTRLDLTRQYRPHVIVLDLMLPGLDGLEVCRRLRTFSNAFVNILTVKALEIDRITGLEVSADDYLTKPFSPLVTVRVGLFYTGESITSSTCIGRPRTSDAALINAGIYSRST
ncbi:MAG: response regulator [Chloroflexota bacterium]|nr:response regulator [Chloroflexota bacterium]